MRRVLEKLWDLLFPRACFLCEREGSELLCAACSQALPLSVWWYCPVCRRRSPEFCACVHCAKRTRLAALGAALPYDDPRVRKLVHSFKYDAVEPLGESLGALLACYVRESRILALNLQNPVLVPVPLHARKMRFRGFNQAEILAHSVGKELHILVASNVLVRREARKPQVEVREARDRKENVKGVFVLGGDSPAVKDRDVFLVDDVVTSGATMEECARVLKRAKARRVFGLALAQG